MDSDRVPRMAGGPSVQREESCMNIEKYTERARGFIQSAQTQALGSGHTGHHVGRETDGHRARLGREGVERRRGEQPRRHRAHPCIDPCADAVAEAEP